MIPSEVFTTMRVNPISNSNPSSISNGFPLPPSFQSRLSSSSSSTNSCSPRTSAEAQVAELLSKQEWKRLSSRIPLLSKHLLRLPISVLDLAQIYPQQWDWTNWENRRTNPKHQSQNSDTIPQEENEQSLKTRQASKDSGLQSFLQSYQPQSFLKQIQTHLESLDQETQNQTLRLRLSFDNQGEMNVVSAILSQLPASTAPKVRLDPTPLSISASTTKNDGETVSNGNQSEANASELIERRLLTNKTSSRDFYSNSAKRVKADYGVFKDDEDTCFDVILWSKARLSGLEGTEDLITESSIANVILELPVNLLRSNSDPIRLQEVGEEEGTMMEEDRTVFITPKSRPETGFLPGLMRNHLMELGVMRGADVKLETLKKLCRRKENGGEVDRDEIDGRGRIYLCNALRGVWEVELDLVQPK